MKPRAIIYLLISLFVGLMSWEAQNAQAEGQFHQEVSAEDAIRLRILANSDSIGDQALKREIRDQVNAEITEWVGDVESFNEAASTIKANIKELEAIVAKELQNRGLSQSYKVEFNTDVSFPTKLYGNIVYPAGLYNAVLITLGEGQGENWWCVLFPPLCFLDMDNAEAKELEQEPVEEVEEVETSFFIVEMFESLWDRLFG
ncbi:stage II sporulation protein R [Shouchella patagoniensis]|uniref:stage II sporulation protein R n=1 Tax=Shouchella patagoniensis TaxID=228576 RepID=UPI00099516BD|nr:stage II sporulation protein R [Shouchella patagoniensis]